MSTCQGTKTDARDKRSGRCGGQLYRCGKCGHIGCSQSGTFWTCTNRGFNSGVCLKCNSASGKSNV